MRVLESTIFVIARKDNYKFSHFAERYETYEEALGVIHSDKFLFRNKGDEYDDYYRNSEYEIVEINTITKIYPL